MDPKYFQERAKTCLRLAEGLSWNNPGVMAAGIGLLPAHNTAQMRLRR
jgi:hypothetical protein